MCAFLAIGLVAVASGCGSGAIQLNDEPVKAPEVFLSKVEREWRADAIADRANLHKQAHCFFASPEGSSNVETTVFCGPVRHFVDSDDQESGETGNGVWDTFVAEVTRLESGYSFGEFESSQTGITLPAGLELRRPDGATVPEDPAQLAAPPPPPMKGIILSEEPIATKSQKKPKDGRVVTPRVTVTVESVGTADRLDTSGGDYGPKKGERLLVARLSLAPGPNAELYSDTWGADDLVPADASFALKVGDNREPLEIETDNIGNGESAEQTIVTSVPKDSDPQLLVSAAGKEQGISLTTGKRTSAAAGLYYRGTNVVGLARKYPGQTYEKGDFNTTVSVLFARARLSPFDPYRGWAEEGRAWLRLETDQLANEFAYLQYSLTLHHAKTTTVTDADGEKYTDLTKSEELGYPDDTVLEPIFEVPADTSAVTVRFEPSFTFTGEDNYSEPKSGTFTLKPMTFDIAFGG